MNIMKLYNVWVNLINLSDQFSSRPFGCQSMPVKQPSLHTMPPLIPHVSYMNKLRLTLPRLTPIRNIALPAISNRQSPNLLSNPPSRASIYRYINLKQFHIIIIFPICTNLIDQINPTK